MYAKKFDMKKIAQNIIDAREKAGMTQLDVALKTGISDAMLSRLECGGCKRINLELFLSLAQALGTSLPALLAGAEKEADDGGQN